MPLGEQPSLLEYHLEAFEKLELLEGKRKRKKKRGKSCWERGEGMGGIFGWRGRLLRGGQFLLPDDFLFVCLFVFGGDEQ